MVGLVLEIVLTLLAGGILIQAGKYQIVKG